MTQNERQQTFYWFVSYNYIDDGEKDRDIKHTVIPQHPFQWIKERNLVGLERVFIVSFQQVTEHEALLFLEADPDYLSVETKSVLHEVQRLRDE